MYIFLMIIHVLVCLVLIFVVLLQAGRGGGFSDMMGGGQPQSVFGTQTNEFMVKATEVCAVLFIVTSLSLAVMSTQRGKSLVARQNIARDIQAAIPQIPQAPKTPPQAAQNATPPSPALSPAMQDVATEPAAASHEASQPAAPAVAQ
jgi:preprotein translocase subunit SecG